MGVWGTGLYQCDAALDVRGAYRDARSLGFSGDRLARLVLDMTGAGGSDDGEIATLALADLLWRDGMLDEDRRRAALALASRSGGVLAFEDAASQRNHARALQELAVRITSPQRPPARTSHPYIEQSDLEIGEALGLPDGVGGWWLLRVVTHYTRFGGRSPVVEVLDWRGNALPDAATIAKLPWRRQPDAVVIGSARPAETLAALIAAGRLPPDATWDDYETQMAAPHYPVLRTSDRDPAYRKIVRLGVSVPATRPFTSDWFIPTNAWTRWKDLPAKLSSIFDAWDYGLEDWEDVAD